MPSESQHLAQSLEALFARKDAGWFIGFSAAVEGLTAQQAARVPGAGFNSVWAIVNHIGCWHDIVLKRLRGVPMDASIFSGGQGFQQPNNPADERAWQAACERALNLNRELAAQIAGMSDAELDRPIETWSDTRREAVIGLIAHNSYHICEIISMRHMQGYWIEKT